MHKTVLPSASCFGLGIQNGGLCTQCSAKWPSTTNHSGATANRCQLPSMKQNYYRMPVPLQWRAVVVNEPPVVQRKLRVSRERH